MAKVTEGKGASKEALTSSEQDEIRRAKKRNRRHSGGIIDVIGGQTLFDGIREDRQARKAERQMFDRQRLFSRVWGHLEAFAAKRNWSVEQIDEAHNYLSSLIYDDKQFTCVSMKVGLEVQRRFALGCLQFKRTLGMPGQRKSWYPEALKSAEEFWESRKAQPRELQPA